VILSDPSLAIRFRDYGIMLPIAPNRAERVLEFLEKHFFPGTRGNTLPYPGPVFTITGAIQYLEAAGLGAGIPEPEGEQAAVISRQDLERVHHRDFIAALYGNPGGNHRKNSAADAGEAGTPGAHTVQGPLERELLRAYELLDPQGRPHRYEPEKAVKPLAELFKLLLAQTAGTYLACRLALSPGPGFCYYLGGGMHHARYESGSGFCLINDVSIAAVKILRDPPELLGKKNPVRLIWIIDLDAHKGDGTAELIRMVHEQGGAGAGNRESCKPRILTLSIHMARGWPLDEETLTGAVPGRAPLAPSDVDIGIARGEEAEYIPRLKEGIGRLERISAERRGQNPDLILVVDGADPYEHDGLPSSALLKLTLNQCLRRDRLVYRYAVDRGIPSAWIQAGGYGERAWEPAGHFLRSLRQAGSGEGPADF
jgi:acetoin utilization deacetylase AcuC-like enzyme